MRTRSADRLDTNGGYRAAALLALLFPVLLCAPVWLSGGSVFKGVIQEQYYILGQFAFDHQVIEDFSNGLFPLWNPHNALGTPLLGNMLSTVFYPLKILVYLVNEAWMRDIYIIIRLWIAGFFAYVFARSLKLGRPASILVMACFSMTGYFRTFINENYLNADALIPLLLISFDRIIFPGRLRHVLLGGVLVFAVLNCGHPEAAFYALLFSGLYFSVALYSTGRSNIFPSIARLGAAFIIGALVSLPLLVTFLEYWSRGVHFHPPGAGFYHYPIRQAVAYLSPWFFVQAPAGAAFLGPVKAAWNAMGQGIPDYSLTSVPWLIPYAGTVTVFLGTLTMLRLKKLDSRSLFFAAFSIFFLGVMFGLPLFNLSGFLPVFEFSGNFKHPLPALGFAFAFLAGKALDDILSGKTSLVLIAFAGAIVFLLILCFAFIHEPLSAGRNYLNMASAANAGLLAALCLALGVIKVADLGGKRIIGPLAVLAAVSCLFIDSRWHRGIETDYTSSIKNSRALEILQKERGPVRTYIMQGITPPNLNIVFGINDLRVMDGINDRRFVELVNEINGLDRMTAFDYWYRSVGYLQPKPESIEHPLFRLLNSRYVLSDNPLPFNDTIYMLLDQADFLSPSPEHIGRARFAFDGSYADALFEHPPSRIEAAGVRETYVSFQPGVLESAWQIENDGVWFNISSFLPEEISYARRNALLYSRYIHPGVNPSDRILPVAEVRLPGQEHTLSFATLPCSSADNDWSGWRDLRFLNSPPPYTSGYRLLSADSIRLYEMLSDSAHEGVLPRAFLAGWAEVLPDESAVLEAISSPDRAYRKVMFLSGRKMVAPFTAPYDWSDEWFISGGLGRVEIEHYGPQKIELTADCSHDCWLGVSDLYYPGWKAYVDGHESRIYRGDYILRALPLAAGSHDLVFKYQPLSFRVSLWTALVSMAFACFFVIAWNTKRMRLFKPAGF